MDKKSGVIVAVMS